VFNVVDAELFCFYRLFFGGGNPENILGYGSLLPRAWMESRGAMRPVDKRSMAEGPMSNDLAYFYTLSADGFGFYIYIGTARHLLKSLLSKRGDWS